MSDYDMAVKDLVYAKELILRAAELLRRADFMTEDGDQDEVREEKRDQWLKDASAEPSPE